MHGHYQKRYADEIAFVRNGQIQNVHVGDRLHFRETQHHINDQRVAEQADDAHDRIQNHRYQIANGHLDGRAIEFQALVVRIDEQFVIVAGIEFGVADDAI